jgi:sugar phosphate isomerase/epimerase
MIKFGVADYGLNVRDGGLYDIESRLRDIKKLGLSGTERLEAVSPSDALYKAALYRKLGMGFSTCRGPSVQAGIEWTAGLGRKYVWITPGSLAPELDFDTFTTRVNAFAAAAAKYGLRCGIHNHIGSRLATQAEIERYLEACPDAGLVFDVGEIGLAGGNPAAIVKKYLNRICAVHLKDAEITDGKTGKIEYRALGSGEFGVINRKTLEVLIKSGYDGWVFIEPEDFRINPLDELSDSLDYLKRGGLSIINLKTVS